MRRMVDGSTPPSLHFSLGGNPSWCYSEVPQSRKDQTVFPRLLAKAAHGLTTTFVPLEGDADCLIRVVVNFDRSILQTLFGWVGKESLSAGRQ